MKRLMGELLHKKKKKESGAIHKEFMKESKVENELENPGKRKRKMKESKSSHPKSAFIHLRQQGA